MSEVLVQSLTPEILVSAVLRQISDGHVEDATASFARVFVLGITALDWSFQTKRASLNSSKKQMSCIQIALCKLKSCSLLAIM